MRYKIIIVFFFLLFSLQVFGYDNLKTHPDLVVAAATIYNSQVDKKLTQEQINWIKDGSIAEDTDPRYKNHYYNPENGQGLSGWDELYGINIEVNGLPAKYWSKHQDSVSGDYSIDTIFKLYKEGNNKRAYQGVGHILHLIQDMAVPAHTRNDSHAMGDPYESWAQQYGSININNIDFIQSKNIDEIFDELANYSNKNFYSKDTIKVDFIKNDNYKTERDIEGKNAQYIYNDEHTYKVVKVLKGAEGNSYELDFKVNLDYWNMLYPQAVGYSAGAIDYFIKEFDKINEEKKTMGFWEKLGNKLAQLVNDKEDDKRLFGDTFLAVRNTAADGVTKFFGAAADTYDFGKLVYESGKEIVQDTAKKTVDTTADIGGKVLSAAETVAKSVKNPITADDLLKTKQTAANIISPIPLAKGGEAMDCEGGKCGVDYVIDGDTIVLKTGEKVRYIGVDAPELNKDGAADDECLAWVARIRNTQLLAGGELKLVKDLSADKDKYGRLLRYVYSGDVFVNRQLALEGLAVDFFCPASAGENCSVVSDKERKQEITMAAKEAEMKRRGIFSDVCLSIAGKTPTNTSTPFAKRGEAMNDSGIDKEQGGECCEDCCCEIQGNVCYKPEGGFCCLSDEINCRPGLGCGNLAKDKKMDFFFFGGSNIETSQEIKDIAAKAGKLIPKIEIINKPPLISSSTAADFLFSVNNEKDFQCKLDNVEWQECQKQISFQDLIQGTHSLKLLAVSETGDIASSSYDWRIDLTAPSAAISDLAGQYEAGGFAVEWSGADNQTASTSLFFDAQYKIGAGEWTNWIENLSSMASFYTENVPNGSNVSFRVCAEDEAGNIGEWSNSAETKIRKTAADHIVISEASISGASEWAELYNPTANAFDFNVNPYYFVYFSNDKNWNEITRPAADKRKLTGSLPANGFYLIKIDGAVISSESDYDWAYAGAANTLADSGGSIALFPFDPAGKTAEEIAVGKIDAVGWGNAVNVKEGTSIATSGGDFSLERKALATSSSEAMMSGGAHELSGNAYDTDDNSNDFIIRFSSDSQNSQSPREPREPIIAEAVGDLVVSHPFTGSNSITLHWTAPKNAAVNVNARYDLRHQIKNNECDLNSTWDSAATAASTTLPVPGSEGAAQEVKISGLDKETEYCFALKIFNGEARSKISNQASATTLPEIAPCFIIPVNQSDEIKINKLSLDNSPYCSNSDIIIKQGASLEIEPGVVIKLREGNNINIKGELRAAGRPDQPIVFTSYYDDEKGGKVSEAEHSAAPGDWGFIVASQTGKLFMEHSIVNYGGQTEFFPAMYMITYTSGGVIFLNGGEAEIRNSLIYNNIAGIEIADNSAVIVVSSNVFNNQFEGIRIYGNNSTISIVDLDIFNNGGAGIWIYNDTISTFNISGSRIYGNQAGGFINDPDSLMAANAVDNWWGDNSGPYHAELNPSGLGNAVEGDVAFDPWIVR